MVLHVYLTLLEAASPTSLPARPPHSHSFIPHTHTATASYRLLPEIILTQPVTGANARKLAKCFAKGACEDGKSYAEVVDPRRDTCSREVLRHEVS